MPGYNVDLQIIFGKISETKDKLTQNISFFIVLMLKFLTLNVYENVAIDCSA